MIHKPNLYSILKIDCLYIRNYTFVSICLSLDVNSRSPADGKLSTVRFPIDDKKLTSTVPQSTNWFVVKYIYN